MNACAHRTAFATSLVAVCLVTVLVSACRTAPVRPVTGYSPAAGEKAAQTAEAMVGKPYLFRGDNPKGFDCSGLVRYSYLSAGVEVPHSTQTLREATHTVGSRMRRGDLLFFDERGKKYSHVGIFVGDDHFVHAPSTGKTVRKDSLADAYWKRSFLDARRFNER